MSYFWKLKMLNTFFFPSKVLKTGNKTGVKLAIYMPATVDKNSGLS